MAHGTYDEFWKARNLRPHLKNIKPAVLTVGGWFDAEDLFGALETYQRDRDAEPRRHEHPGDGPVDPRRLVARRTATRSATSTFGAKTADVLPRADRAAVLQLPPEGQGRRPKLPEAWVFETGTNQWRALDAWPPQGGRPAALLPSRRRPAAPSSRPPRRRRRFDEYVSDPAKPVPFIDDDRRSAWRREYMVGGPALRRARGPTCSSTRPSRSRRT